MVHLTHSAIHWKLRCIEDTSSDENTPPNILSARQCGNSDHDSDDDDISSTGTEEPPWLTPERARNRSSGVKKPPPISKVTATTADWATTPSSPPSITWSCSSSTTSSPVLKGPPPRSPVRAKRSKTLQPRREGRQSRQAAAAPYARPRLMSQRVRSVFNPAGSMKFTVELAPPAHQQASRSGSVFIPARWSYGVAYLREQFNPLATIFPAVSHSGSCGCRNPCRIDTCRNALMHVYCYVNCCPYGGKCGNGLEESSKVFLGRNMRTSQFGVIAAEDIQPGEVLGQYLGEIEHVSVLRANRPRNRGYRLVMKQRPEKPTYPVCVAINAEGMGGLMRFVNHLCRPVAEFIEVPNGRRTTVVVATTKHICRGEEVTVDYGDDLWFVCRCGLDGCRHSTIQDEQDP